MSSDLEPASLVITCSMRRDEELFGILAESADRHLDPTIRHMVIVPAQDVQVFRKYAGPTRDIVAQEDVLPFRIRRLPVLQKFSRVVPSLRRPLYLGPSGRLLRGWIIQQVLKIEAARQSRAASVLHVDSDVFFFRNLRPETLVADGKPRLFVADGGGIAEHARWRETAGRLLGVAPSGTSHFIENCIVWSPEVVRSMVDRIAAQRQGDWWLALIEVESVSEYFVYGTYCETVERFARVTPIGRSLCHSLWHVAGDLRDLPDPAGFHLAEDQCALAIQSTHPLPLAARRALFEALSAPKSGATG